MAGVITVSTLSGLYNALAHATGGETIRLAGGDYGNLALSSKSGFPVTFPSNVTITSADPLHPASFSGFALTGVSNLTLDGVVCDYRFKPGDPLSLAPFSITGGDHVTIRNSTFDGDTASGMGATSDGFGTGYGLSIRNAAHVTFDGNEMSSFHRGLVVNTCTDIRVTGNDLSDMRSDGMDFAQVQGAEISGNHLHDFRASPLSADHPDMIQFWTTGTTAPSTDIVIRGNLLDIGDGTATQSIFLRNERVDLGQAGSEMYYRNVTIEENVITNAHLNGIVVGAASGVTISHNSLLHADGGQADGADSGVEIPQISVNGASTGVSITGNATSAISGWTGQPGWMVSGNAFVQDQNPAAPGYYGDVFISSSLTAHDGVHTFLALPGGMIDALGAGAAATRDRLPDPGGVAALFQVGEETGGAVQTKIFDAGLSLTGLGSLPAGTVYEWAFGDGTIASGQKVIHSFAAGGHYGVSLTVRLPDGTSDRVLGVVDVDDRDILRLGTDGGFLAADHGAVLALDRGSYASAAGLQLGSAGVAATVARAHVAEVLRAQDFDIGLRLDADSATSYGEVFRLGAGIITSVTPTGTLLVRAFNAAGTETRLTSASVMTDLRAHDIDIRLHDGALQLWVDGKMAAQTAFSGTLNGTGTTDLVFGNPWGAKNFYGDVTGFDIKVGENALAQDRSLLSLGPDGQFHTAGDSAGLALGRAAAVSTEGIHLGDHGGGMAARVEGSHVADLLHADDFDIALRLDADTAGSYGNVFRLADSIVARVLATGELLVRAFDTTGGMTDLVTTGLAVNDTRAHDIDIRLHDGKLQIWVDGTVAAQTGFAGTLQDFGSNDLVFGRHGRFHGDITAFDITVAGDTPAGTDHLAAALAPHAESAWSVTL